MKKTYGLIGFGILAFVLFFSLVSASISVSASDKTFYNDENGSYVFTINNNGNDSVQISIYVDEIEEGTAKNYFNILPNTTNIVTRTIENNTLETITIDYGGFDDDFEFGKKYTTSLIVNGTAEATLTFIKNNFCEYNNEKDDLEVSIEDVSVEGFGDEDEWYLKDEIEVEIKVDNKGDWDLDNIEIEWELYSDGESIDDGKATEIDLKDGDDETIYFTIKLDENIDDFGSDATLYVRATGEIDSDDENYDEKNTCASDDKVYDIAKDDFVIVDNIKIDNVKALRKAYNDLSCDSEYTVSFEAWNIGDSDEDDVYVEVYSKELEIYEKFEMVEIEAFDSSQVFEFDFEVPEDLEDGIYTLEFEVFDEDGDIYENGNDDESRVNIRFENQDSCLVVEPTITATLDSEAAVEGKEMIVKISVRNDDVQSRMFTINPEGYQEWAKLKEVSTETFELESGMSEEITATFEIKRDMEGEKEFKFNVFSDGKLISTQPMAVTVEAKQGLSDLFDGIDWKIVGIVFINLALVIAIIIVVRKILKKK